MHRSNEQKAAALTLPMLRRLLATCDPSPRGRRDWALLLFGFAGPVRGSAFEAGRRWPSAGPGRCRKIANWPGSLGQRHLDNLASSLRSCLRCLTFNL